MKAKIRTKIATRRQTLVHRNRIAKDWGKLDSADCALADGNRDAVRVILNVDTGLPNERKGRIEICAPWALQWGGASDPVTTA